MKILDKMKSWFTNNKKQVKKDIDKENRLKVDELVFFGNEKVCSACDNPIHASQKKKKIGKKHHYHRSCFRMIEKIGRYGYNPEKFLENMMSNNYVGRNE